MAALSELITLPDAVMFLSIPSPSITSPTGPSKVTPSLAVPLENVHNATDNYFQMALAPSTVPSASQDMTATSQVLDARSTSTRATMYRLKPATTGLSLQASALGIVGGTKGNIRGPQCCVM
jgi:hypothetical protein